MSLYSFLKIEILGEGSFQAKKQKGRNFFFFVEE